MADIFLHVPVRSISLPSRLHPNSIKIEEQLTKLKFSSTSNLLQSESIRIGLTKLAELFISIDELSNSPQIQKCFHQNQLNQVEDVLDSSIGLIDICSHARDLFLTMQEHIQDLQSVLRRKGNDSSIESNIQAYINFRKKAKKDITKSIRMLKKLEKNTPSVSILNEESHLSYLIKIIKEAQAISASIFQSVLFFISLPVMKNNINGWSLISKMIRSGFLASENKNQKMFDEVEKVDIVLFSIKKNDVKFDVKEMRENLKKLNEISHEIEDKLDFVFRYLIQNRVSLLNLITP